MMYKVKSDSINDIWGRLPKGDGKVRVAMWCALAVAITLCLFGLYPRLKAENATHNVGMIIDYRDIVSIARETGMSIDSTWDRLYRLGISGMAITEATGRELMSGTLPIVMSSVAEAPVDIKMPPDMTRDRAVIWGKAGDPMWRVIIPYISIKMPAAFNVSGTINQGIVLPASCGELGDSGVVPDISALGFSTRREISVAYRPSPCIGVDGIRVADSLKFIMDVYGQIKCILPAGVVVPGYPDIDPIAGLLAERQVPVAQVEFVKQAGAPELVLKSSPRVIPLHSLVRDEVLSRNMTVPQMVERMVRAVHERSIRFLMVRPYDIYTGRRAQYFADMVEGIKSSLVARGYNLAWPSHMNSWSRSHAAVVGSAVALAAFITVLSIRFKPNLPSQRRFLFFIGAVFLGSLVIAGVPFLSRYLGGLLGALAATEATLAALDGKRNPYWGSAEGVAIVVTAGLCIASFYGVPEYMLRLKAFSGVKMTLLLPPLLVLLHDMWTRVYPENPLEVLARPPLWGELVVVGVLMLMALFMAIRSDNTALVPMWEVNLREGLERVLRVRPRTKEFLVGYPCLLLWYITHKHNMFPRYREVFRIGASLGFASAVNTFCHLHTQFILTIIRTINGWWLGMIIGTVAAVAVNLAWMQRHRLRASDE